MVKLLALKIVINFYNDDDNNGDDGDDVFDDECDDERDENECEEPTGGMKCDHGEVAQTRTREVLPVVK